jgi:hypothetical protein
MADIRATQSGDFSATSTWVGGVVPGSSDVAFANTFTVTISDTRTVQAISNASGTSITVGGTFSLLNGANLTCTNANGVVQGNTATSCITTPSLGVGSSASVAASVTTGQNQWTVIMSTAGTLNWVGNLSASGGFGTIQFTGSGIINYTGNIAAGSAIGIVPAGAGTLNVTGNVTGGSAVVGVRIDSASTVNVNGTVTGGSSTFAGILSSSNGTLTVNGTCQSSTTAPAIGAGSATQITRLSGPFLLGASGNINPVQAQSWRWAPTQIPTYWEVAASNGTTKRSLFTSDNIPTGNYPTAANVRSGTVYGPNLENTGTCAVPSASAVSLGTAVDNTTGTAVLTAASVRAAVGLASANLDTQLSGISAPSAATVATAVRTELTTEMGRIDAAISTRLAPSGTLARVTLVDTTTTLTNAPTVPSAAAIASQVRTELTTELGRIDVATSTRLAAASYSAPPTTAAIRTELSVELARLDAAVSTRLASASYTAPTTPPTAAAVASQVRTELTAELARVSNCATVDSTGAQIQAAVSA